MKKFLFFLIIIALIAATYWVAVVYKPPEEPEPNKPVPVEVRTVDTNSIEDIIELTGWIKANKVVELKSKVQGRIESLNAITPEGKTMPVDEGLVVKKGWQVAVIDHDVYEAQVAGARAALQARRVELEDAEREKNRIIALYEDGSATEQSRDKAITTYELARARLNSAEAELELTRINLDESVITSPIDGVVTHKHIDAGNLISVGTPICTIAEISTVKVIVPAAERYLGKIKAGSPAPIRVDAFEDRRFDAQVYSVYPALDEQTHTIQVEIRIENRDLVLRPGMFARVELVLEHKEDVIVVLGDVVLGGKLYDPYVYVIQNNRARRKIVKLGIQQGKFCEIVQGLEKGQQLVINGMHYLQNNKEVEIVKLEEVK